MQTRKNFLAVCLVVAATAGLLPGCDSLGASDPRLLGRWTNFFMTAEFKGSTFKLTDFAGDSVSGNYTANPSVVPNTLDLNVTASTVPGDRGLALGFYEIDGNTLGIFINSVGRNRPANPASAQIAYFFVRVNKDAEWTPADKESASSLHEILGNY